MAYTREQIGQALKAAHEAGDTEAARQLAIAYRDWKPATPDPAMTRASTRANDAFRANQKVLPADLTQLGKPDFSTGAMARLPAPTMSPQELDAWEAKKKAANEALRVPDSNFKERSIIAMNVPTFGSGPRLAAGAQTLGALAATPFIKGDIIDQKGISGATSQFLDEARIHQRRGRTERPVESIATEVVPSLFQGKTIIDTLGKKLLPATNTVSNVARVAGVGGGYGALYGASQNESGTVEGVAGDAAFGGALGVGGGLVLKAAEPAATAGLRTAKTAGASMYDALASALGKAGGARDKVAQDVAVAAVRRSMERSGMTFEQIMEQVKRYEGKPAVLAEVIGQDAVNSLTALTRRPGSTPQKAQDIIEERFYGRPDRLKGDVEDSTGIRIGQLDETLDTQLTERQEAAKPIYDALYKQYSTIKSFGESLKRINRLAGTPAMQKHLKLAEEAVKTQAAIRQVPISKMSKMEYWDLVKRSLDDEINSAVAKGEARTKVGASVAELTQLKKALTDEFDRLTDGAYAAAREAGGEAPRLKAAAAAGQKALQARNPRDVARTVAATLPQDLPALRAGIVDDLGTRIDKGMTPGRVRVPDVAGKLREGLGEEAANKLINRFDAEAALSETGSRWAPRMNSVTGTVMESGATQMGDDLINAGMNLATGNKLGLVRQAINFMRQRGFSQRQIDAIGDLLLSSPEEGLKRLKLMAPDGMPTNAAAPLTGLGPNGGLPPPPPAGPASGRTPTPTGGAPAGRIMPGGFGSNQSGAIRTDVATTIGGATAGWGAGEGLDLNFDGKVNWEDNVAGAMYGIGGKYAAKAGFKGIGNALANPGRRKLGISKGGVLPEGPVYERVPTMEESFDNRFAMARMTVEQQARKAGETLTPEQLQQRAVQEYRDLYKKDPPGVKSDGAMEAQGWQRALNDAFETLKKERGEGNFTAYDVEQAAVDDFVSYYGAARLPKDTLEQADRLVPGTVDPNDLKPQGFSGLRTDAGNAAAQFIGGAAGTGLLPVPEDTPIEQRLAIAGLGGLGAMGLGRRMRSVGQPRNALADAATAGMGKPRTPQQAARFETPGSPESLQRIIDGEVQPTAEEMRGIVKQIQDAEFEDLVKAFYGDEKKARAFKYLGRKNYLTKAEEEEFARLREQSNPDHVDAEIADVTDAIALRNAIEDIEGGRYEDVLADAFRRFPLANEIGERVARGEPPYRPTERLYASIARRAIAEAKLQGRDPAEVFDNALKAYGGRFSGDDKAFMVKSITDLMNMGGPDKAASPILTAGIGGGGRGPRKPLPPPPPKRRDIGTKAADATAIAALGIAPPADGQSGDGAELQAANERVKSATQRVADVDKSIAQLEADKRLLENPKGDPKEIQRLLKRRGFNLGPRGVDGVIGPDTDAAIKDNIAKIEAEIARKGGDRETAAAEVEKARKGVTQAQMLQIQRERETGPVTQFLRDNGATIGVAAGLIGGYASRRGAVKKAAMAATKAAQQADALVNTNPVNRRSKKGLDGIDTRAPNLNKFWDEGGAGENVPFEAMKKGGWKPKPRAASPQSLYRPPNQRTVSGFVRSRVGTMDLGMMAAGVAEAKTMEGLKANEQKKMDKAQADVDRYFKDGNVAAYNDALARLETSRNLYATYYFFERAGYGFAGARALATLKSPYTHVRPNIAAAEKELKLLRDDIAKP